MDKKLLKKLIEEKKEFFDMFMILYGNLTNVRIMKNVGVDKKHFMKFEEDIENDLKKIKEVIGIEISPEEDEELKSFTLEWGQSHFNWLKKDH